MLGYKSPSLFQMQDIISVYQWKLWVVSLGRAVTQMQDVWVTDKLPTLKVTWQQQFTESMQSLVHNTPQLNSLCFHAWFLGCPGSPVWKVTLRLKHQMSSCTPSVSHPDIILLQLWQLDCFLVLHEALNTQLLESLLDLIQPLLGRCNALLRKSIVSLTPV